MNNRHAFGDFFSFGLAASLYWHIFWVLLMVPVLRMPVYKLAKSQSIFLGAILKDSDLVLSPSPGALKTKKPVGRTRDLSRESYFDKTPLELRKPMVLGAYPAQAAAAKVSVPVSSGASQQALREISFGPKDFNDYAENIDLSDLKNYSTMDDLSPYADFQVFLSRAGEVSRIRKITGTGDPAVDLTLMRKLKNAVFKPFIAKEAWVRVRFNIK